MAEQNSRDRWNGKYANGPGATTPASFLTDVAHLIPTSGSALDVAGGSGRNALWLAAHGLNTTLLDVSDVALAYAATSAADAGLSLSVMDHDLEADGFPAGQWDVIFVHLFLDWDVMDQVKAHLTPCGLLVFMQPTVTNLERNPSPGRRFLLEDGALERWVAGQDLEILHHSESWIENTGRYEGRLVARRS